MDEETRKKIIYIAVAQLGRRIASFDDEKLAMETDQFGNIEFTKEEVRNVLIKVNAEYQEVVDNE